MSERLFKCTIVTDEYYNSTAIPMDLVKEVKVDVEARGGW